MKQQLLILCALSVLNFIVAKPEGYFRQHYEFQQQSSSYRNNELQHKKEESGKVTKFGDLDGSSPPQQRSSYRQSEYHAPEAANSNESKTRITLTPTGSNLNHGSRLQGIETGGYQSSFSNSEQSYQTAHGFGPSRPVSQSLTMGTTGSNTLGTGLTSPALTTTSGAQSRSYSYNTQSLSQPINNHAVTKNTYWEKNHEQSSLKESIPVVKPESERAWRSESSFNYGTVNSGHSIPRSRNLQAQSQILDSAGSKSRTFQTVTEQKEEKQTRYTNVYQQKPEETIQTNEDLTQNQHIVHINDLNNPERPRGRKQESENKNNGNAYRVTRVYYTNDNENINTPIGRSTDKQSLLSQSQTKDSNIYTIPQNQKTNIGDTIKIKITPQNPESSTTTQTASYSVTQSKVSATNIPQTDSQINKNFDNANSGNIRYIARVRPVYQQSEPELEPEKPIINNERHVKSFERTQQINVLNSNQEQQNPQLNTNDQTTHQSRTIYQSSGYTRTQPLSNSKQHENINFNKQELQNQDKIDYEIPLSTGGKNINQQTGNYFEDNTQGRYIQKTEFIEPQIYITKPLSQVSQTKSEFQKLEYINPQIDTLEPKVSNHRLPKLINSQNHNNFNQKYQVQEDKTQQYQDRNEFGTYNQPQQDLTHQTNIRTFKTLSSSQYQQNSENLPQQTRKHYGKLELVNENPNNDYEELEFGQNHKDFSQKTNSFETGNKQRNNYNTNSNNNPSSSYSSSHSYSGSSSYSTKLQPQISTPQNGQFQYYETIQMPPGTTRQEMEQKLKERLQEKLQELQLQQQKKINEFNQRNSQQMISQSYSTMGGSDGFGTGCDDQNEGSFSSSYSSGTYAASRQLQHPSTGYSHFHGK